MKTSFLGQAYQSRSPILASQTAINIYPEITETQGSAIGGFYGTPGLIQRFTGEKGPVRGLYGISDQNVFYAVIDDNVYRVDSSYSGTNLGQLPNSTGLVSIVDNGTQVAFGHRDGMHWVASDGIAIAPVSNAPLNPVLTVQDNYVLYTDDTTGTFGLTALGDLSSVNPLDVANAEGKPDKLISVFSFNREANLLGTFSREIWADTGAALFPFERVPSGFNEQGCCARYSVCKADDSLWWAGQDTAGRGMLFRSNGYSSVRVSNHAVEFALSQMSTITDCIGYSYQQEGHTFVVFTFPSGDQTWVYDVATKGWHQRAYMDSSGLLHRHRSNCYTFFNGKHLVGDYQNGKVYEMSPDAYDDAGDAIYRERAWELPDNENKKIRGDYLEVVALTGDGEGNAAPQMALEVSQDGGRRWGYERIQTLGKTGQHYARARWRRLGTGRNTVYRVSTEMRNRISWVDAIFKGEALAR